MACLSRCQLCSRSAPITPPPACGCWLESCCAIFSLRVCCTQFCTIQQATGPQGVAWMTCEAVVGVGSSLGSPVVEVAEAHPNPEEGVHCCMPTELGIKALNILNPDALIRIHFDHLAEGLVDGTVVDALLPAFEKKDQHLIRFCVVRVEHALSGEHLRALEVNESMRVHLSTQSRCLRAGLLVCLRNPTRSVIKQIHQGSKLGKRELDTQSFNFATLRIVALSGFAIDACFGNAKLATLRIVALSGFAIHVCFGNAKLATLRIVALSGFAIHVCFGRRETRNAPQPRKRETRAETRNSQRSATAETRNSQRFATAETRNSQRFALLRSLGSLSTPAD
jgi:hypothetical protein